MIKEINIKKEIQPEKKRCVILYGTPNSGKSSLWDSVLGYGSSNSMYGDSPRHRHLPDGLYCEHHISGFIFDILLIGQSLEETNRADLFDKLPDSLKYDILFISVQKRMNSETINYLKNIYDIKLFEIEESSPRLAPKIPQDRTFLLEKRINSRNNRDSLLSLYADRIIDKIINW